MTRLLIALASAATLATATAKHPNILIIVSDDHGYADAGFQGSKLAVTPNLDALAKSGITCTSGYVTYPVCSPSRAGLLTGRHQARFGHDNNPVYDPLDNKEGLPLTETILPQFLKRAGYHTGWIGKWHLGSAPAFVPWARGFDESFGFIGGGHRFTDWLPDERQYSLPLIRAGKPSTDVPPHLTLALGNAAAAFIRSHKDHPWMLYLPFNAPHTPHEPSPDRLGKFSHVPNPQRRKYLAQLSLLDDAIGLVTSALADSNQRDHTLTFFFSDNGGHTPSGSDNSPLRAMKGTLYEGGVRVPFLVSWPAKLPAGQHYHQPVSSLDVLPSALAAADIPVPTDRKLDGVNLIPHLTGEVSTPPHTHLTWRMHGKQSLAIRSDNWKLIRSGNTPPELYDLASDASESKDVAAQNADVVTRLSATLESWNRELVDPVFPGSSVKNEDWGPGGANQRNRPKPRRSSPKPPDANPPTAPN
jgi:arylsulfatase A-like enzyme